MDENPVVPRQRHVVGDRISGLAQGLGQSGQILDKEGRMRLTRRHKILFDAEMNLQFAVFKPAAAASREIRGPEQLWAAFDAFMPG